MVMAQNIDCIKRDVKNKQHLKVFKRKNFIPGIVYGKGEEALPVFLPGREFDRTLQKHGMRGLFSLAIDGMAKPQMVLIREIQKNPIKGNIIHVDFLTVSMDEKVNTLVTILINGEDEIIKKGALLQTGLKEVEVLCFPQDIPDNFACDVSHLEIGDKIIVRDLDIPQDVELISDPEAPIVIILAPGRGAASETEPETEETEDKTETETEA